MRSRDSSLVKDAEGVVECLVGLSGKADENIRADMDILAEHVPHAPDEFQEGPGRMSAPHTREDPVVSALQGQVQVPAERLRGGQDAQQRFVEREGLEGSESDALHPFERRDTRHEAPQAGSIHVPVIPEVNSRQDDLPAARRDDRTNVFDHAGERTTD